jgi:excisionase family DNA binding protein
MPPSRPPRPGLPRQTFDVADAAAVTGLSRATIYRALKDGSLPAIRLGRRVVVARPALERLLGHALPDAE